VLLYRFALVWLIFEIRECTDYLTPRGVIYYTVEDTVWPDVRHRDLSWEEIWDKVADRREWRCYRLLTV